MKTDKHYVGLSHREIITLGKVSGEAFRLYVAVASFAYGSKTTCYPTWKQIGERMGKKLSSANGQTLAKKLEAAGLLQRGAFGTGGSARFTLTLKAQIIEDRGGKQNVRGTLKNHEPEPSHFDSPPLTNHEGVNIKTNNKNNNSFINKTFEGDEQIFDADATAEDNEEKGWIQLSSGWIHIVSVCSRLEHQRTWFGIQVVGDRRKLKERFRREGDAGEAYITIMTQYEKKAGLEET
jgi:hypothetical protein